MQQINSFAETPMNDIIAKQTIIDHKYLLELVENRCAICFYACSNRNQSLFNALVNFIRDNETPDFNEADGEATDLDMESQEFKSQS
jgi:hypothetical protein